MGKNPSDDPRKSPLEKGRSPRLGDSGRAAPDDGVLQRALERRREAEQLIARQNFDAADPILQKLAKLPHESTRDVAAWARQQIQRLRQRHPVSEEDVESTVLVARKLFAQHDYAESINVLSAIPEGQETHESTDLLERATQRQEEVDELRSDIDAAVNTKRYDEARPMVKRILELKPSDRRMQDLWEELNMYGDGGRVRAGRRDRGYGESEGFGIFSAMGLALAVAAVAFVGGLMAITNYLGRDERTIEVDVDPAARGKGFGLGVGNAHHSLDSLGKGVALKPGNQTISLTLDRVEVASVQLDVKKGPNPSLHVAIQDGRPLLTYGGDGSAAPQNDPTEIAATTTPVKPPEPIPAPVPAPVPTPPAQTKPADPVPPGVNTPEGKLLAKLYGKFNGTGPALGFYLKLNGPQNQYKNIYRMTDIPAEGFEILSANIPDQLTEDDLALLKDVPTLRSLTLIGQRWTGDELRFFAGRPDLDGFMMHMGNYNDQMPLRECRALPHLATLPKLRVLALDGFKLTSEQLKELSQLKSLQSLNMTIDGMELGPEALRFPELRQLTLRCFRRDSTGISDDDLAGLSESTSLNSLQIFRATELTGAGLRKVSRLAELRFVQFMECPKFDDEGLKALARIAPNLSNLSVQPGSSESSITREGIAALRPLKTLQQLALPSAPGIDDEAMATIVTLPALRYLEIPGCGLTDKGVKTLLKHKTLARLDLTRTQLTDDACADLAKMVQIESLDLGLTEITDDGLKKLKSLKKLRRMNLNQTNISKEAADELKQAIPGLEIYGL